MAASGSGDTFEEEEGDSNNDNEESELDGPINIESAVTSDKCLSHSDNDFSVRFLNLCFFKSLCSFIDSFRSCAVVTLTQKQIHHLTFAVTHVLSFTFQHMHSLFCIVMFNL